MIKRREAIARADRTLRFMRCFEELCEAFAKTKPLPIASLFQRSKIYYKLDQTAQFIETNIYLFDSPIDSMAEYSAILNNFEYLNSDNVIDGTTVEYIASNSCVRINSIGKWILITKIKVTIILNKIEIMTLKYK